MSPPTPPFMFDDAGAPPGAALVAEVPPGIRTKEDLLRVLAERLRFPDYFGANWDALWDCLNDFSWLPAGPVVLRHADVPLMDDAADMKTYLTILRDAAQRHRLVVGFPAKARERVEGALRSLS
jgi:RNAse (barnase) inhibitor barstar